MYSQSKQDSIVVSEMGSVFVVHFHRVVLMVARTFLQLVLVFAVEKHTFRDRTDFCQANLPFFWHPLFTHFSHGRGVLGAI